MASSSTARWPCRDLGGMLRAMWGRLERIMDGGPSRAAGARSRRGRVRTGAARCVIAISIAAAASTAVADTPAAVVVAYDAFERAMAGFGEVARESLETLAVESAAQPRMIVAAHARWYLALLNRREGRAADFRGIGMIRRWAVLGPLARGDAHAADNVVADWRTGTMAVTYRGRSHAVTWHDVSEVVSDGVVPLDEVTDRPLPGTVFARAVVELSGPADGAIRVGSTVPYRIWLDGRLLAAGGRVRPLAIDQDVYAARWSGGRSDILVAVDARAAPAAFIVRLTTPDGRPLAFDHGASRTTSAPPDALPDLPIALADPIARAEAMALADPSTAPQWAAVADRFRPSGVDDLALVDIWERAIIARPDDVALLLAFARSTTASGDRRRRLLERARVLAPDAPDVRRALARHEITAGSPRRAAVHWSAVRAHLPDDPEARLASLETPHRLGLAATTRAALAEARTQRPADPTLGVAYAEALIAVDRLEDAQAVLRPLFEARPGDVELWARLRRVRLRRRDFDALIDGWSRHLAASPFSAAAAIDAARDRFSADSGDGRRRAEALAAIEALIAVAPERADAWAALGDLREHAGDSDGAVAAWRRSLALDGAQPTISERLEWFEPDTRALYRRRMRSAVEIAMDPPVPPAPSAGAYYLFDATVIDVQPSGLSTRCHQYAVQLRDRIQADALRVHQIGYTPAAERLRIVAVERIRPDGEVAGPARTGVEAPFGKTDGVYSDYEIRWFAFDELAPGDVVHVAYIIEARSEGDLFIGGFGGIFEAQALFPKAEWSLDVRLPAEQRLRHDTVGLAAPAVHADGGRRLWTWRATGLVGETNELSAPPSLERHAHVALSTFDRWSDVAGWYHRLVEDQAAPSRALVDAARAVGERAGGETAAVVEAMYDFVVERTRYVGIEFGVHGFKPYAADTVLRRGYGDCKDKANLLVAMLAIQGVAAEIVLVRSRGRGAMLQTPPSPFIFDHAVAYVPALDLYLDPTVEHGGPRELPIGDQGAMGLHIDPARWDEVVTLPTSTAGHNAVTMATTIRLVDGGMASIGHREVVRGTAAAALRAAFQSPSGAARAVEHQWGRLYPGFVVDAVRAEVSDRHAPAVFEFEARVPGYARPGVEPDVRQLDVTPSPVRLASRFAPTAKRRTPLDIGVPWRLVATVELEPVAGGRLRPPPDEQFATPFGRYERFARRAGQRWIIDRLVELSVERVEPVEYEAFRAFCRRVDAADDRQARWMLGTGPRETAP